MTGGVVQPVIDYYDFGIIVVNGKEYRHDIVITPSEVKSDWWRIEGHRLQLADVRDFLCERVDDVVIGTGYSGLMRVDKEVVEEFERRGVRVHIANTREAVRLYNSLVKQGRRVMAFLHLTC